jgi:hypothetical protein
MDMRRMSEVVGFRGIRRSFIPACSGVRASFRPLQVEQAVTTFSQQVTGTVFCDHGK